MESESVVVYQIRIKELLDQEWSDWFAPLKFVNDSNGETVFIGEVRDLAELHSLLNKVFNLNLTLLSVNRLQDISTSDLPHKR